MTSLTLLAQADQFIDLADLEQVIGRDPAARAPAKTGPSPRVGRTPSPVRFDDVVGEDDFADDDV